MKLRLKFTLSPEKDCLWVLPRILTFLNLRSVFFSLLETKVILRVEWRAGYSADNLETTTVDLERGPSEIQR